MATRQSSTLSKGLRLLEAVVLDAGRSTLTALAAREGMPLATAHRLAATLQADGYLVQNGSGCLLPGMRLAKLHPPELSTAQRIATQLRRPLAALARKHRILFHFGVLEDGMVTYLVKENGGEAELFTAEQMQLEAYCSAVGKVLLAALPQAQLDAYLANGPFVALTPNTLTQPGDIREELATVGRQGFSFDRYEIREDLFCIAVPVRGGNGDVCGGLSCSFLGSAPDALRLRRIKRSLKDLARKATPQI
ncbi:IclR family transcriptional regulator [Rhizorhabdus histidinilytica]|uniref:IclR family transcriptional regulator n=1 Tax=Rhizorhabdus histidinilytica TaxID=439228 RepID=UPI001ADB76C8|nr:IclR family transcriptional regulator [Rhizorhabdus histidinilytica]